MAKFRGFLIDPVAREISAITFDSATESPLEFIYDALRCERIDVVRMNDGVVVYVDDEGLLRGVPEDFFVIADSQPIASRGLIVGTTPDGDDADCPHTIEEVRSMVAWLDRVGVAQWIRRNPDR